MRRRSILLLALCVVCGGREGFCEEPAVAAAKAGDSIRHDFGNFSFEIPKGWRIARSDQKKTEAALILGGPSRLALKGMIKVDAGIPAAPTAKGLADAFAKSVGATVESEATEIDGTAAARVDTGTHSIAEPGVFVAAIRDEQAYLLMGAAANGVDLDAAIETIRKSWKWSESAGGR